MHIEGDKIIFQGVPVAEIIKAWPTITDKFVRLIELAEQSSDEIKILQDKNEDLEAENEHLGTENERLKAENEHLKAENEHLKAENEWLRDDAAYWASKP